MLFYNNKDKIKKIALLWLLIYYWSLRKELEESMQRCLAILLWSLQKTLNTVFLRIDFAEFIDFKRLSVIFRSIPTNLYHFEGLFVIKKKQKNKDAN